MKAVLNCLMLLGFMALIPQGTYAQKPCCPKGDKSEIACKNEADIAKACCSSTAQKESTSGCTPSNCKGAKTKFGEAKVISALRAELISLKALMEEHDKLKFSENAISVHGIIGETDEAKHSHRCSAAGQYSIRN